MKRIILPLMLTLLMAAAVPALAEDIPIIEWVTPEPAPTPVPLPSPTPPNNSIGGYRGSYRVETKSHRINNDRTILVDGTCAVDGNLITAWNSNQTTKGQWIRLTVADGGKYEVAGFRIAAGYWKNREVYTNNFRPRNVDIYCDEKLVASYELQDLVSYQTCWFPAPVTCSSFKLTIRDGYEWLQHHTYKDCAITELDLIGPGGGTLCRYAMDDWGLSVRTLFDEIGRGHIFAQGDQSLSVLGLQLLLKEGFSVYSGSVNSVFDGPTRIAVNTLAETFTETLGDNALPMIEGVVDANYMENMLSYMDTLGY